MRRRLLCGLAAFHQSSAASAELTIRPGWLSEADVSLGKGKRITFIRHAEGWHNKDGREKENYYADKLFLTSAYSDASLTPDGKEQAYTIAVKQQWRMQNGKPDVVVVSPLTRA